jgi:hypothetical protein
MVNRRTPVRLVAHQQVCRSAPAGGCGTSLPMRMTAYHGSGPWTYRMQGCGAIDPRPIAGSPLVVIPTA